MKRPYREESLRWLTQARDEFEDADDLRKNRYYIPTRYPNGLPGGVPSQYFDDPEEAKEAMQLAKSVIDLVERKIKETERKKT
ncbi:MAG TPA: HEPN domain-containing protein [Candidatus Brocadiales bacterium]|nr:HEPN domain-containing protein [Candidatus Brocadiales bacterium]